MQQFSDFQIAAIKGRLYFALQQFLKKYNNLHTKEDVIKALSLILDVSPQNVESYFYFSRTPKNKLNLFLISQLCQQTSDERNQEKSDSSEDFYGSNDPKIKDAIHDLRMNNLLNLNLNLLFDISVSELKKIQLHFWTKALEDFLNLSIANFKSQEFQALYTDTNFMLTYALTNCMECMPGVSDDDIIEYIQHNIDTILNQLQTNSRLDILHLLSAAKAGEGDKNKSLSDSEDTFLCREIYEYFQLNGYVPKANYQDWDKHIDFFELSKSKEEGNVKNIDIMAHSGIKFLTECRIPFEQLLQKGVHIRVLLNDIETTKSLIEHFKGIFALYPPLQNTHRAWAALSKENDNLEVRVTSIPLFHRLYIVNNHLFTQTESLPSTVDLRYYTFGNSENQSNPTATYEKNTPEYRMYCQEFDYLWKQAVILKVSEP